MNTFDRSPVPNNLLDKFSEKSELSGIDLTSHFKFGAKEYQLTRLSNVSAMENLAVDWRQLEVKSTERFDYFQSFDWCMAWAKTFADGARSEGEYELSVYVLRGVEGVCLIWPMVVSRAGFGGVQLQETLGDPLTQYANVLFDPSNVTDDLGREVWRLIKSDRRADAIVLNHYAKDSFLDRVIGNEGIEEDTDQISSILNFSKIDNWEQHTKSWSKSHRKQQARAKKKLEAHGDVTLEVIWNDEAQFIPAVRHALELKRDWLRQTGRQSQMLFEDDTTQFLQDLGERSHGHEKRSGAVVFALCVGGAPISYEIGMLQRDHYYSYLGAIDMTWQDCSPGKIQIELTQKWAFENDFGCFDFLSDPSEYKRSWRNETVGMYTRFFPLSYVGSGYCSVWKAKLRPALKNIYHHASPNVRKSLNKLLSVAGRGEQER